jgi:hypothetical protein
LPDYTKPGGTAVKLLYAMAFALFPLAAAAQTPDALLLAALCHDDYFEDTAGHCNSLARREELTMEEVLAHYGEIISSDADDESVFYLIDLEEVPVGAIEPRQFGPSDNPIESKDDGTAPDLTNRENAVAAQIITIGSPHENGENVVADADDLGTTDPAPAGLAGTTSILTGEDPVVE